MVRRAKAKAKAAAARVEQGTEPEAELTPRSPKHKSQKEKTLPEPEAESCTAVVDIRHPVVRSQSEQRKAIGFAIILALKAKRAPLPRKPRQYNPENWDLLTDLLKSNLSIGLHHVGTQNQCDLSNALVFLITELSCVLDDSGGDQSRYENLLDISVMIGPLAERLFELLSISCD